MMRPLNRSLAVGEARGGGGGEQGGQAPGVLKQSFKGQQVRRPPSGKGTILDEQKRSLLETSFGLGSLCSFAPFNFERVIRLLLKRRKKKLAQMCIVFPINYAF